MDTSVVDRIIEKYQGNSSALIAILQDVQQEFNYIPEEVAVRLTDAMNIPLSRAYGLTTFFKAFSLTPRGRHPVSVCLGTACHVKGGQRILERIERELNIKTGETTKDLNFGLEAVRCLGCCGLAPVVTIGEDLYGQVNLTRITSALNKYKEAGKKA